MDNVLLGYETAGRLTGFRAMLYRSVAVHGKNGTRARHLRPIWPYDPELPLREQLSLPFAALGEVHSYIHPAVDSRPGRQMAELDTLDFLLRRSEGVQR